MLKKFLRTSLIIAGIGCLLTSGISDGYATDDSELKFKPGRPKLVDNKFGYPWKTQVTDAGERVSIRPDLDAYDRRLDEPVDFPRGGGIGQQVPPDGYRTAKEVSKK